MKWTRRVLVAGSGAFLGALIISWLAPKAIAWYFDPPVNVGVSCRSATEWAMARLLRLQLIGTLLGALGAILISGLSSKKSTPEK